MPMAILTSKSKVLFAAAAAHSSIEFAASDGMESILQKLGMAAHTDAFQKVHSADVSHK